MGKIRIFKMVFMNNFWYVCASCFDICVCRCFVCVCVYHIQLAFYVFIRSVYHCDLHRSFYVTLLLSILWMRKVLMYWNDFWCQQNVLWCIYTIASECENGRSWECFNRKPIKQSSFVSRVTIVWILLTAI